MINKNNANNLIKNSYDISSIKTNIDSIEISKVNIINCNEYNYRDRINSNTYHRLIITVIMSNKKYINILSNYEYKSTLEQKLVEVLHELNLLNKNKSYNIYSYCKRNNITLLRNSHDIKKRDIKNLSL